VKFITIYYILIYTLIVNSHNDYYVIMLFTHKMVYNMFSLVVILCMRCSLDTKSKKNL